MNPLVRQIALLAVGGLGIVMAWRSFGWPGLALAVGAIVFWALLHVTRLTQVMKRAAQRPIGYVDSAVMLNARLRPGVNLLHVVALTRALGEPRSDQGEAPEVYRWQDAGGASVTCEFRDGKLARWQLERPAPEVAPPPPAPDPAASTDS